MCIEKKDETLNNVLSTVEDQIIIACYPHDITNLARFCVTWFEDTCLTIYTGKCNEDDSIKTIAAVCIDIHNWKFKYKELEVLSDPQFANPAAGDFHISGATQVARKTGDPRWLP